MKNVLKNISHLIVTVSPTRFFIIVATFFGLLFIILTPPFQAPDEQAHFLRAYQVSELNFVVDDIGDQAGGHLPVEFKKIFAVTNEPNIAFRPNLKYDIQNTKKALTITDDESPEREFYEFSSTSAYSPLSYLPQSLGILVAKALQLPLLMSMYAGRLGNLIAWVGLMTIAIRLIPIKKWLLVALGLLPMAIFQAGSLSSDIMATGLVAVFFAFTVKLYFQQEKIRHTDLLLLFTIALSMTLSKQIMFMALPLILLLPRRKFERPKMLLLAKLATIVIPLLLLMLWLWIVRDIDIAATAANKQDSVQQLKFILQNPHSFINTLWNTHFFSWGDSITRSFIGVFGWADAPLSELITTVGYTGLAILAISTTQRTRLTFNKRQRIYLLLILIGFWLAINAALYLYYSPVGFKIIVGLQGRYFLPLAIIGIPLWQSNWLRITNRAYKNLALALPLFLLVCSVVTAFVRYYINNV